MRASRDANGLVRRRRLNLSDPEISCSARLLQGRAASLAVSAADLHIRASGDPQETRSRGYATQMKIGARRPGWRRGRACAALLRRRAVRGRAPGPQGPSRNGMAACRALRRPPRRGACAAEQPVETPSTDRWATLRRPLRRPGGLPLPGMPGGVAKRATAAAGPGRRPVDREDPYQRRRDPRLQTLYPQSRIAGSPCRWS